MRKKLNEWDNGFLNGVLWGIAVGLLIALIARPAIYDESPIHIVDRDRVDVVCKCPEH